MRVGEPRQRDSRPAAHVVEQHVQRVGSPLPGGQPPVEPADRRRVDREEPGAGAQQSAHDRRQERQQEAPERHTEQQGPAQQGRAGAEAVAELSGDRPHEDPDHVDPIEQGRHFRRQPERGGAHPKRQKIEDRGENAERPGGAGVHAPQLGAGEQRPERGLEPAGIAGAGRLPGQHPVGMHGRRQHEGRRRHEGIAPVQRRMQPAAEQPPPQTAEDGGRNVCAHNDRQIRGRQRPGEISGQAGRQGRNENPLREPRRDQDPKAAGDRTDEPATGHADPPVRTMPRIEARSASQPNGQIGQGDPEYHGRYGQGHLHQVGRELLRQHRQDRLGDVDVGECGRNQREDDDLETKAGGRIGRARCGRSDFERSTAPRPISTEGAVPESTRLQAWVADRHSAGPVAATGGAPY